MIEDNKPAPETASEPEASATERPADEQTETSAPVLEMEQDAVPIADDDGPREETVLREETGTDTEPPSDEFKPFYEKEARVARASKMARIALHWLLLVLLGVGLPALAVQAYLADAPFVWEAGGVALLCLALVGLGWKKLALETKVGIEAVGNGIILALAFGIYGLAGFGLWGLTGGLLLPLWYGLALLAVLAAVWITWPRPFWLPLLLTVLVLYAVMAPVIALVQGGADLKGLLEQPGAMSGWLGFLGSGYLMVQVVLPLGALLFLFLQVRVLFGKSYRSLGSYFMWALFLLLCALTGLLGLADAGRPVFPDPQAWVASLRPVTTRAALPAAPVPAPAAKTVPAPPPVAPRPAEPASPPAPAEEQAAKAPDRDATPREEGESSTSADAAAPAVTDDQASPSGKPGTAPEGEAASEQSEAPEKTPASEAPPSAPSGPGWEEIRDLRTRVRDLEDELQLLRDHIQNQDQLIRSILTFFGSEERPGPEADPSPPPQSPSAPDESAGDLEST
ncbi:MAG: hypothetical protein KKB20_05065 [Proteobacteria bacterium]|nr:hypothetical protein [Pseudomonadota bacterium]